MASWNAGLVQTETSGELMLILMGFVGDKFRIIHAGEELCIIVLEPEVTGKRSGKLRNRIGFQGSHDFDIKRIPATEEDPYVSA